MIKLALVLAVSLFAAAAHAGPQVEEGRSAPVAEGAPAVAAPAGASLDAGAAIPALPEASIPGAAAPAAEAAAAPAAQGVSAAAATPAVGSPVASPVAAPAAASAAESPREASARRMIETGTADWTKADPGAVGGAESAGAAAPLAKPADVEPSRAPEPPSEPRGFGGRMLFGQFITGLGFMPLVLGVMGIAGTTPLIVGVALLFPGLFLVFRSEPPKDAFLAFLSLFGGLFSSFSLAGWLQSGNAGNAWVAGAILGATGLGMMAIDEIGQKNRGGSSGARQVSVWVAFAGYAAGIATMIELGSWHNGLGVLVGLGLVLGIGVGSLLLPPLLDALKALFARAAKPAPGSAPAASRVDWARLAGMQKQLVWGGGLLGALLSGAAWLFNLTAVSPLFSLAFAAPVAGVMAGFWLWQHAKRKSGL